MTRPSTFTKMTDTGTYDYGYVVIHKKRTRDRLHVVGNFASYEDAQQAAAKLPPLSGQL